MVTEHRADAARPSGRLAATTGILLAFTLALAAPALAAEGGPSANTPVPAGSGVAGSSSVTATAAAPITPAPTATGQASTPAAKGAVSAPTATTPAATSTVRIVTARTGTGKSAGTSNGAIAIAIVAALIVLGCLLWAGMRMLALQPRWTLSLRHALAEAGYRASATWAELGDWMRLGH